MIPRNKQGMSGIITMLIIIALALVAIGVVWYVIQNILEQGQEQTEQGVNDIFSNCEPDGDVMINKTHIDAFTICSNTIRIIGGKYCCIP